jgi:hypothetical protein
VPPIVNSVYYDEFYCTMVNHFPNVLGLLMLGHEKIIFF